MHAPPCSRQMACDSMLVAHVFAGDGGCDALPLALRQLNRVNHWSSPVIHREFKVVALGKNDGK